MRNKFCPKCGRETNVFYGNLCKRCYSGTVSSKIRLPSKIVVKRCKRCSRIYVNDKIVDSLEKAVDSILSRMLNQEGLKSASYRISKNKVYLSLVDEFEKEKEIQLNLVIKSTLCRQCYLKESKYFQAILQIRSENDIDSIVSEIENLLTKIEEKDKFAFISDIIKNPNGADIYLGSTFAINHMVRYLKNKYNAKVKISRKLFGMKEGKKIYRMTVLAKIGN